MERRGIVCGVSWLVDHNNTITHWPEEETLAAIVDRELQGGGPAHNMAVDLARLGAPFPIWGMGAIGGDEGGRLLLATCREHGIDPARIQVIPGDCTGHTDVMTVQGTGRRTFFQHQGAGARFRPADFDPDGLPARILHLGAPCLIQGLDDPWEDEPNGWVAVLRRARAAGLRTNLEMVSGDPATLRRLVAPCLPYLDSLIVNDFEAGAVAGVDVVAGGATSIAGARRAAATLLDQGVLDVVAVHFPSGCVAASRSGGMLTLPSVKVPAEAIRGSNGAGDAFAAGLLYGLHEGWPLDEGLRLGLSAAAAGLRAVTTTGAVGTVAECLALAREWGWRDVP